MLDFLPVLALVADDPFDTLLRQNPFDAFFLPGCRPGGVFMQKIPTGVDLVLVYLHYEAEMYHRADVLSTRDGGIPQLAVEGLPCAERLAGGASYYEDGILISKQRSCTYALVGPVKIPGLTIMRIDGGKVERYSRLE